MFRGLLFRQRRLYCSNSGGRNVGSWRKFLGLVGPTSPSGVSRKLLVPTKYVPPSQIVPSANVLADLKWLMQKIKLKQDIFLIGPPSRYRSQLVLMMLELLDLEFEYIMLNRDTSESDLKQRKELQTAAMSSVYVDQCVVRAATTGRILVLDGVEKAERNLLPIINNLVENREMQLEDGRFMLPEDRYRSLTEKGASDIPLVPVHSDFRVICIGLPTPPFRGHNLDPPFRSRFQARKVSHWPLRDQFLFATASAPSVDQDRISRWISFSNAMASDDIQHQATQLETREATASTSRRVLATAPPYFPVDSCLSAAKLWENCPLLSGREMIEFVYPTNLLEEITPGCAELVKRMAEKFDLWKDTHQSEDGMSALVSSVSVKPAIEKGKAEVTLALSSNDSNFLVPSGAAALTQPVLAEFVETDGTRKTLVNMLLAHSVGDFCVVGARGSGKTANIARFANLLGYDDKITTVMAYQDMTARDLLQQRITRADGSTGWEFSPVIRSAIDGGLLILDGVHVLNASTLMVLKRLVEDREVFLPDGTRGLRHDRFDSLKRLHNLDDKQMKQAGLVRIHPSFRMIGVAEPPTASKHVVSTSQRSSSAQISAPGPWLTPDVNGLFLFVSLPPPTRKEELQILETVRPTMSPVAEKLVQLSRNDASLLSLRQKLRILKFLEAYPETPLHDAITSAALYRFMNLPARTALTDSLSKSGIKVGKPSSEPTTISIADNKLTIGDITTNIYAPGEVEGHSSVDSVDEAMRIPSVLFYDNSRQLMSMAMMLKALLLGDHLLVIGNQGVGKNRIVDRLLELWKRPRHYAQLHRDSTVQSLTVTPSVTGGRLHFEDSPLLKAVRAGHILVLDEADKAPVHVTRVLKGLVESGHMLLPDGRRISKVPGSHGPDTIALHPEFRMIVLANPPGYPFLGNNFFASLGDLFSCHIVDNPDFDSEMELVRNYAGHNFDPDLLRRLTASFAELRSKANEGLLPYPYSTRELINVVRHLAAFPNDSVRDALRNVFDFDSWNESSLDAATSAFGKYGIQVERANKEDIEKKLAPQIVLPTPVQMGRLEAQPLKSAVHVVSAERLTFRGPDTADIHKIAIDQTDGRLSTFSEFTRAFSLDLPDHCTVQDACITQQVGGEIMNVLTINPSLLISFPLRYDTRTGTMIMLNRILSSPYLKLHPFDMSMTADPGSSLMLFDIRSGRAATMNTLTGSTISFKEPLATPSRDESVQWRSAKFIAPDLSSEQPYALSYRSGDGVVSVVDFLTGNLSMMQLPFPVKSISPAISDKNSWIVLPDSDPTAALGQLKISAAPGDPMSASLQLFKGSYGTDNLLGASGGVATAEKDLGVLTPEINTTVHPNFYSTLHRTNGDYSMHGVRRMKRVFRSEEASKMDKEVVSFLTGNQSNMQIDDALYLDAHSLLVSSISSTRRLAISGFRLFPLATASNIDSVLEIVNVPRGNEKATMSHVALESEGRFKSRVVRLLPLASQDVASVMANGQIRVWEVVQGRIQQSLSAWQHRLGMGPAGGPDAMEKTISQLLKKKAGERLNAPPNFGGPKHGKIDPSNAPHAGGNQWAGGSGGRDTAGMGGAGGPYRLDAGHPIQQVPDWVKEEVPDHIKQAAREIAQRTYAERLKEIRMSKFDAELYESFSSRVKREVAILRNMIESLPSSKNERIWLKNQSDGDLDENKLIEGLTGEKTVYKRRVEPDSEEDRDPEEDKPRLLSLLVDVSGSMARFNSVDMRLEREAAAVLMVMESLAIQGERKRVIYDIYGHSGETDSLEFCRAHNPPKNAKERLHLLQSMQAHTMFCMSGDSTLQSIRQAIARIKRNYADTTAEKFIVLLSDANLSRYGIPARMLAEAMAPPDLPQDMRVFAIMIGSLGSQAESLVEALPAGQGYVCMDTASLPNILQQILTTTLLLDD